MTPEQFATHSSPVNKTAFFTVYCPNMGYRDDQRIECCEEYENVLLAINSINDELRTRNLSTKKELKKFKVYLFQMPKRKNLLMFYLELIEI